MLEACCNLAVPDGGWKLVAVNNGSTDRTGEIIRSFVQRLPLEVICVPTRGKNRALNAAINHVEGDLVIFTDDDVVPDRHWLIALEKCARLHPGHAMFGGPIRPRWPRQPEAWILTDVLLGPTYALTAPSILDGEVSSDVLWGPNMAVRRSVVDRHFRFDINIGPDGTDNYMMGSELEFTRRLARDGLKAWFCVGAKVEHVIREHQLSVSWILRRAFRHGRSAYYFDHIKRANAPRIFGVERWLYTQCISSRLQAIMFRLLGRRDKWFKAMRLHYYTKGKLFQAIKMRAAMPVGSQLKEERR